MAEPIHPILGRETVGGGIPEARACSRARVFRGENQPVKHSRGVWFLLIVNLAGKAAALGVGWGRPGLALGLWFAPDFLLAYHVFVPRAHGLVRALECPVVQCPIAATILWTRARLWVA